MVGGGGGGGRNSSGEENVLELDRDGCSRTLTGVNFMVRKLYLNKAVMFYLSGIEMGKQEVRRNAASSRSWDPSRASGEPRFPIHVKLK